MGGAIGGLVAAGFDIEEIEDFVLSTPWYRIVDIGIGKQGLVAGNKVYAMLLQYLEQKGLGDIQIEHLPIPFRAVSVDLVKGEVFIFDKGSLSLAIRATTSVPGFFQPVKYEDKVLVDGGVLNNLPADITRKEGAEIVIAVDVEREREEREPRNMFDVLNRSLSLMMVEMRRSNLRFADVIFRPQVGHYQAYDITKIKECIEAGEREAEQKVTEVMSLINNKRRIPQ
jgi:NTE family protein